MTLWTRVLPVEDSLVGTEWSVALLFTSASAGSYIYLAQRR